MDTQTPLFFALDSTCNLRDGYRKSYNVEGLDLLLIQHQGSVYLLESYCPHAAYPLQDGLIIDNDLRCPMHGYLFDLDSGDCTLSSEGPCRGLHRYQLHYQNEQVGLMLPAIKSTGSTYDP